MGDGKEPCEETSIALMLDRLLSVVLIGTKAIKVLLRRIIVVLCACVVVIISCKLCRLQTEALANVQVIRIEVKKRRKIDRVRALESKIILTLVMPFRSARN